MYIGISNNSSQSIIIQFAQNKGIGILSLQTSCPLVLLPVSCAKFKVARALKGRDGVLDILPSGSIIFVLWTVVLSTAPHPSSLTPIWTCFSFLLDSYLAISFAFLQQICCFGECNFCLYFRLYYFYLEIVKKVQAYP